MHHAHSDGTNAHRCLEVGVDVAIPSLNKFFWPENLKLTEAGSAERVLLNELWDH